MKSFSIILVIYSLASAAICSIESDKFYKVLQVSRNASKSEIKEAYKNLVKTLHPDKNRDDKNATEKFAEVRAAFEVLGDDKKRKLYDKCGEKCLKENVGIFRAFEEFNFFGHSGSGRQEIRGANILMHLDVTLEEIYSGGFVQITRNKAVFKATSGTRKCNCKRELVGRMMDREFVQFFQEKCDECPKLQLVQEEKLIDVEIERGQPNYYEMIFNEEGEPRIDGAPGDLIMRIRQQPHPSFQRRDHDLFANVTISLQDALIGFSTELIHLDGHRLLIARDSVTFPGEIIKIENEGMPYQESGRQLFGALFVSVHVEFPKTATFTDSQKETIRSLFE